MSKPKSVMYSDHHEDKFDHELLLSCWSAKDPTRVIEWKNDRKGNLFRGRAIISYNGVVQHDVEAIASTKEIAHLEAAKTAYFTLQYFDLL